MDKISSKRLFAEGLLIVFSVLFALFISQLVETNKVKKQTRQAIERIDQEIDQNNRHMDRWIEKHTRLKNRLDSLVAGHLDDVMNEFKNQKYFDLGILMQGEALVDALIVETAWKTAESTNIMSHFDYDTVEEFTTIYGIQDIIMKQTLSKILDIVFSRETLDLDNLEATLYQLNQLMFELNGQESVLSGMYKRRIHSRNK